MKGLAVAEESSVARPILQLFCRSGGYLADIYSGSFVIQDITSAAPVEKVASTPLTSTQKIATGRYAITTGATSAWTVGSHRVVVTYTLESGGPEYTQVIPFEVLTAVDWPTGMQYVGYISSKLLYDDEYLAATVTVAKAHRLIARASRQIELWTHRFFEPRYLEYRQTGRNSPTILLEEAIIALEDVWSVWESEGVENSYKYEQYLYKVYNRHLDGYVGGDDRANPKLDLVSADGDIVTVEDYVWPHGAQNLLLKGIFGYTDPDYDPMGGSTGVGSTPYDIGIVTGALTYRYNADPTMTDLWTYSPGSVRSMRTRDQSITFGSSGGGGGGGGSSVPSDLSGDPLIDNILVKYTSPVALVGI